MYGNVFWEVNILTTVSLHKLMGRRISGYLCFQGALEGGEKTK